MLQEITLSVKTYCLGTVPFVCGFTVSNQHTIFSKVRSVPFLPPPLVKLHHTFIIQLDYYVVAHI